MRQLFSTAEVAAMAGIHRDTLLRWLRERTVLEPCRDRHGWRVFTAREAAAIAAFAKGNEQEMAIPLDDETAITRLEAIEWDFATAKTGYLTHGPHPYPAKFIPQIPNALVQGVVISRRDDPLSAFENAHGEPRIREYRTIVDRDRELCTKAALR